MNELETLRAENARLQADYNRLKAQLEATEASRASWERKAAEMSIIAFLRLMQLEAAGIQAKELEVEIK